MTRLEDPRLKTISDVLVYHHRIKPPSGKCGCGHDVGLGRVFYDHPAEMVLFALDAAHDRGPHVEVGGQRMTVAQFNAARQGLLDGVASDADRERLHRFYSEPAPGVDAATWSDTPDGRDDFDLTAGAS